jgi:hypothetical protein
MVSEDPVDPGVEWIFPRKIVLHDQRLGQLTYEINAGQVGSLNNYFFSRGGYAPIVHTRLVLGNAEPNTIQIGNIQIIANCRPPLNGAHIKVTGMPATGESETNSDIPLIYKLTRYSTEADAYTPAGANSDGGKAAYFLSHSVPIKSKKTQAFDIWVVASNTACTFWYKVTIFDGATKVYQVIGDGNGPFRISSLLPAHQQRQYQSSGRGNTAYGEVCLGGSSSSNANGALTCLLPAGKRGDHKRGHH